MMFYLAFGAVKSPFLVMINVPIAIIGGVFGFLSSRSTPLLPICRRPHRVFFGIPIQSIIIPVICFNQLYRECVNIRYAVITGCLRFFRPGLITSITTRMGLMVLLF